MGRRKLYGLNTMAEFKALFEVCEETGCWLLVDRKNRKNALKVRLLPIGKRASIGRAGYFFTNGKEPPRGMVVACTCDTEDCGNPKHRKLTRPGRQQERGKKRSMAVRAKIALAMRARSPLGMTLELAESIRKSDEPAEAIAARLGISRQLVQKIKRGRAWMPLVHGASVFSMAGR